MSTDTRWLHALATTLVFSGGCATVSRSTENMAQLKMLMPSRIEIVEPFTRVKSFDEDSVPVGIELLLQAVNSLDNPGLMIVGDLHVELYEYVPATAANQGTLLERWDISLTTTTQQRTYWNQLTQMYEFRLGVDPTRVSPKSQYVLAVTYNSPLGDHLADQCVLRYRAASAPRSALGGRVR